MRDQNTINTLSQQVANPFYGLNSIYPKTMAVSDLLRPYPEFGDITETQPIGYSWYHALQVRAEKRFSRGYTALVTYTYSKFMEASSFLNAGDPAVYRSISQYDRPHRLTLSGIYELPFGKGRLFASHVSKPLDLAIGGWQVNAIVTYQSGPPLGFGNAIFNGGIKDIPLPASQRTVDAWFNTAGFVTSSSKQLLDNVRTFPLYFAGVRGDGQSV
ncbi:MAG: hypothetical protein ABI165_02230, partial [Bryobacteraceae bacterium]